MTEETAPQEMNRILAEVFEPVDGDIQLAITLNPDKRKVIECMLRWGKNRFEGGRERERIEWIETVSNNEMNLESLSNRLDQARSALEDARNQIEYLHGKFTATGSGNAVLSRISSVLSSLDQ